jgi:hypothetical protein
LDLNTDAVNRVFPNNEIPLKLVDDIQLDGQYWDNDNKVHKYKIEYGFISLVSVEIEGYFKKIL